MVFEEPGVLHHLMVEDKVVAEAGNEEVEEMDANHGDDDEGE